MSKIFHLVIDATIEFCQLQRPSFGQKMQIQDLLIAYMDKLPTADLKAICHHLASSEHAPKALILKLCEQSADICRPILLTSEVLQDTDIKTLIDGKAQIEHARIIARRPNLPHTISTELREFEDFKIDRALDLRQRPIERTNDNLVLSEIEDEDGLDGLFLRYCTEQNDAIIHTAFADRLGLHITSCEILCTDLTSRNLPTAMKFIGLSEATAWALYRRLAKSVAKNPRVADAFRATYNCLTRQQCKLIVSEWQMDELVMEARYNSAANRSSNSVTSDTKSA